MTLKALMVDVDGVVVHPAEHPNWSASLEADLGLSPVVLREAFFAPHWRDIVLGRAGLHERLAPVLAQAAPQLTSQALADYWFAKDSRLDRTLLGDIDRIRARDVQAHLATVQEHERARYLWEVMGLSNHFDAMHYSARLGAVKPEPAFFAAVEQDCGFAPDELFYIDDKPENVAAARARGWPGALWTGERRLFDLMAEAGVSLAAG